jgi:hypothetical protein
LPLDTDESAAANAHPQSQGELRDSQRLHDADLLSPEPGCLPVWTTPI